MDYIMLEKYDDGKADEIYSLTKKEIFFYKLKGEIK
jgi:hypothetical protein